MQIIAADAAGEHSIASTLGTGDSFLDNINKELKAQGLKEATAVTKPVTGVAGRGRGCARPFNLDMQGLCVTTSPLIAEVVLILGSALVCCCCCCVSRSALRAFCGCKKPNDALADAAVVASSQSRALAQR